MVHKIVFALFIFFMLFTPFVLAQTDVTNPTSFFISGSLFTSIHNFFTLTNFGYKNVFLITHVKFQQLLAAGNNVNFSFTIAPLIFYPVNNPIVNKPDILVFDFSFYDFSFAVSFADISMHLALNFSESDLSSYFLPNYVNSVFSNKPSTVHTFLFIPSYNTEYPVYYHGILPFFLYSPSIVFNAKINSFSLSYRMANLEPVEIPGIEKPLHYIRVSYSMANTFLFSLHGGFASFDSISFAVDCLINLDSFTASIYTFSSTSALFSTINVGGMATYSLKLGDAISLAFGGFFDFFNPDDPGLSIYMQQYEWIYGGFTLQRISYPVKNTGMYALFRYKDSLFDIKALAFPYYSLQFSEFFVDALIHMQFSVLYMTFSYEDDFYRIYRSGIKIECGIQYSL